METLLEEKVKKTCRCPIERDENGWPYEYDENGNLVPYCTVEECFDELEKELIEVYGEDVREMVNKSRKELNSRGWNFQML